MNKLLIVLLAVCLISVHAFVKRETEPVIKPDAVENIQKQMEEAFKSFQNKFLETFKPEEIKKNFYATLDSWQNGMKSLEEKKEAPKA